MPCEPDAAAVVVAQSKSPDALMLFVGEADGLAEQLPVSRRQWPQIKSYARQGSVPD